MDTVRGLKIFLCYDVVNNDENEDDITAADHHDRVDYDHHTPRSRVQYKGTEDVDRKHIQRSDDDQGSKRKSKRKRKKKRKKSSDREESESEPDDDRKESSDSSRESEDDEISKPKKSKKKRKRRRHRERSDSEDSSFDDMEEVIVATAATSISGPQEDDQFWNNNTVSTTVHSPPDAELHGQRSTLNGYPPSTPSEHVPYVQSDNATADLMDFFSAPTPQRMNSMPQTQGIQSMDGMAKRNGMAMGGYSGMGNGSGLSGNAMAHRGHGSGGGYPHPMMGRSHSADNVNGNRVKVGNGNMVNMQTQNGRNALAFLQNVNQGQSQQAHGDPFAVWGL